MDDPYADEVEELFRRFNLPRNSSASDPLIAEAERRQLKIEVTQRVDLQVDSGNAYAAKLLNPNGEEVAYAIGSHPRKAAIQALWRHSEGKHDRAV